MTLALKMTVTANRPKMARQTVSVIFITRQKVAVANTAKNKTNVLILPMMVRKMALINKIEWVPYGDTQVPMDSYECGGWDDGCEDTCRHAVKCPVCGELYCDKEVCCDEQ